MLEDENGYRLEEILPCSLEVIEYEEALSWIVYLPLLLLDYICGIMT